MAALSQFQLFMICTAIVVVLLYILTIVWVIRDAPLRGVSPVKWGIIALIPFVGAIIYSALRPAMLLSDKEEQQLDYLLKQRELMKYGECGRCSYPVRDDYIMCPNCGSQLKNVCTGCGKPLNPEWNVCPYCCTKVPERAVRRRRTASHSHVSEE
ncbi:MAG: zinc ribbon domain-containing protein [Coriobacteriales bacterium]|jgi:RNA polymerase subunit RPABC4/transcription elongation factor Spt4